MRPPTTACCLLLVLLPLLVALNSSPRKRTWRRVLASPDIPLTSFSCSDRPMGYYADVEASCQVYHMCGEGGRQYSYKCPNLTLFHQRMLICAHWYQVNCTSSPEFFGANLLIGQRDRPFVEEPIGTGKYKKPVFKLKNIEDLQNLRGFTGEFKPKGVVLKKTRPEFERRRHDTQVDLEQASTGSVLPFGTSFRYQEPSSQFGTTESSEFRPTNVSFRSTIETPYSEPTQTVPMTPEGGVPPPVTIEPPSRLLQPPILAEEEEGIDEEENRIELHLEDPRASLYIPPSGSRQVVPRREEIVVSIPVRGSSRFKPTLYLKELVTECKRCHPMFIIDKKNCSPCLVVK